MKTWPSTLALLSVATVASGCDAASWLADRLAAVGPDAPAPSEEPVVMGASVAPVETGPATRPQRTEHPSERTVIPELSNPMHEHDGGIGGVGPDPATEELWDCPMCGMG